MNDTSKVSEESRVGASLLTHDPILWRAEWKVEKFSAKDILLAGLDPRLAQADELLRVGIDPYEVIEKEGNLLTHGGASALWHRLVGGTTVVAFDNANAHIGVGDSTTAAAATQTDLQAATNKLRKAMDATYPQHTDGTGASNDDVVFKSTFATGDANFAWQEWGVFNASTAGRMLNRKVESLGTKTSAASWAFTVTLTLA